MLNAKQRRAKAFEQIEAIMKRDGISASELSWWAQAEVVRVDAETFKADPENWIDESKEARAKHDVWAEFDSQFDVAMDDGRNWIQAEFEMLGDAIRERFGERK